MASRQQQDNSNASPSFGPFDAGGMGGIPSLNDMLNQTQSGGAGMPSLNDLLRRFALMNLFRQQQQQQQGQQQAAPAGGSPQQGGGGPQVGNVFGIGGIPGLNQLLSNGLLGGLFGKK